MATTYPKRYNFQTGTGSVSGTTITFDAAPSFATLSTDEYIPITFVHATPASSEIVYLTAYTSGATTGTVVRAREGTSEGTWNAASTWEHAPTADLRIMNADIGASAAIALSKLASDPLARANHTGTQAASTISDFTASTLAATFPVGDSRLILPWANQYTSRTGTWVIATDTGSVGDAYYSNSSGAQNDETTWTLALPVGTFSLIWVCLKSTDYAIATWKVDGTSIGTVDMYAGSATRNNILSITGWTVAAAGTKTLQYIAATKNASSSSYKCALNTMAIVRTA